MHVVALIRRIWNKKLAIKEARYLYKGISFTYQYNITERKQIKGIRGIIRRIITIFNILLKKMN